MTPFGGLSIEFRFSGPCLPTILRLQLTDLTGCLFRDETHPPNRCTSPPLQITYMTWETHFAAILFIFSPVVKFRALYSETTACSVNSFTVHYPSSSMHCSVITATAMTGQTDMKRPLQSKPAVGILPHFNACTHLANVR
jgi:hypothetical protein